MTMHQDLEKVVSVSNLLTLKEQAQCEQIGTGKAPHNKRALALLALNEGITQTRAAEQAGLTIGQVKYWLAKFRKQRLGIFPDTLMEELNVVAEGTVEPVTEIEGETEPEIEERVSPANEAKVKKGRKGKKVKKTKKKTGKAKKDLKDKKAKETKKKKKAKKNKKKTGKGKKKSEISKRKKEGKGKKNKKGTAKKGKKAKKTKM